MGREARTRCTIGTVTDVVTAVLESRELFLRGNPALRRKIPLADIVRAEVREDELHLQTATQAIILALGAVEASRWQTKIQTPPPSLAAKLGISPAQPASAVNAERDPTLWEAIQPHLTADPQQATCLIALVQSEAELSHAIEHHATLPCRHLWLVYEKGKAAHLGDAAIRERLRASGYMDNKTAAVSDQFTATRYARG